MKFIVRNTDAKDVPSILDFLNPIIESRKYSAITDPLETIELSEWIDEVSKSGISLTAVKKSDDKAVGIQLTERFSNYNDSLKHVAEIGTFVSFSHQGLGIGKKLFDETVKISKQLGYSKLIAIIRSDNPDAISFYKSLGFRIVGVLKKHILIDKEYLDEILCEILI